MNTIIGFFRTIPITRQMCFKGFSVNGQQYYTQRFGSVSNSDVPLFLERMPVSYYKEFAVRFHSAAYFIGGTVLDREEADNIFYNIMQSAIHKGFNRWWNFPKKIIMLWYLSNIYEYFRDNGSKYFHYQYLPVKKMNINPL